MLNNLTNFFNIITGKMIKKVPENSDLIPLGTKDTRYGGSYKPTAISVEDFINSIPIPVPGVVTDGITITGNGTSFSPLVAVGGSSAVNYTTVLFVDPTFGNNTTALFGRFDKPYLTIAQALIIANGISRTVDNRVMIWVRKGLYADQNLESYTNVDVYCEAGVVFTGSFFLTDLNIGSAVNFNWYGFAKWNLTNGSFSFRWSYASTVLIQGDSFYTPFAIAISLGVTSGTSDITYDFNSMESTLTNGSGYTFSWRNNCNGTLNVKKYIKSPHTHHDVRTSHSGTITVNCPNNILTSANIYGGNFKQIVYISSSLSTSNFNIKGDLVNESVVNFGGLESMVLCTSGKPIITINGNITIPAGTAVSGRSSEIIVVNGNVTAGIYVAYQITGAGEAYFNSGVFQNTTQNPAFLLSANKKLFIRNASIYNGVDVTSAVDVLSNTSNLYMYNCIAGRLTNSAGYLVYGGVAGVIVQLQNIRSVAGLHPNVTDQLSPTGLIVDTLLTVPKY